MPVAGEYHYFRCDKHKHDEDKALRISPSHDYRCGAPLCERPAKAYWYRGEQWAALKVP